MDNTDNTNNTIRVSFKNTEYEQKLKNDILAASKQMGKSTWIKIVCAEKLYNNNNNDFDCPKEKKHSLDIDLGM